MYGFTKKQNNDFQIFSNFFAKQLFLAKNEKKSNIDSF